VIDTLIRGPSPSFHSKEFMLIFIISILLIFCIFVHAFSKWFYVTPMPRADSDSVTRVLLQIFSFWGLPHKIVSDNGSPFNSNSYKQFCTFYDITLSFSPHHPHSNSQAERSVQICKKALRKICDSNPSASSDQWPVLISKFLLAYLNTPSTVNGKSPNQLLLNYVPRTLISNLHPKVQTHVTTTLPFKDGDSVNLRIGNAPILKGIVVRALSPTRYLVSVEGVLKTVHLNQMSYAP